MKKSFLALALAFGLSAGLAAAARADQMAAVPSLEQVQSTESQAVAAYNAGINPEVTVPVAGIYDDEDRHTGTNGLPLPGYANYFSDPSN